MTQYNTQLQPRVISSLRKQIVRNTHVDLRKINKIYKQSYPNAHQDLSFDIQFEQSILSGCVINKNYELIPKDISVKLTGIYSIHSKGQSQGKTQKDKQSEHQLLTKDQFVNSISRIENHNKKIYSQNFVEGTVTLNWELLENQYIGQFQFIFQQRLPETHTLLVGNKIISFCYYLQILGEDMHYLREIEYKKKKKSNIIDPEQINYVVQDFQTTRMCCIKEGNYRIEVLLDRTTTTQILGSMTYFRTQLGILPPISRCDLTLYAQIKYKSTVKGNYEYIHIMSKSIEIDSEPQFGIMSTRLKLTLPTYTPRNIKNEFCVLRYFLVVTPEKICNKNLNIRILEESIRSINLQEAL